MNSNLFILCDSTYGDVAKNADSIQSFENISFLDVRFSKEYNGYAEGLR